MAPINELDLDYKIERICSRLLLSNINNYRDDIFKNLRNYIKYDPELKTFRNLSLEHYNEVVDEQQGIRLAETETKINDIIDKKVRLLANEQPINIITDSVSKSIDKKYNSTIDNTRIMSIVGIGIGLVNIASLYYLFNK